MKHKEEMKLFLLSKGFNPKRVGRMSTETMESHVNELKEKESLNDKDAEFIENSEQALKQSTQQQQQQQAQEQHQTQQQSQQLHQEPQIHEKQVDNEAELRFAVDIEKVIKLSLQIASQEKEQSQAQYQQSRIVNSFGKDFKEKVKETSTIKGWKYDHECKGIAIKKDHGRCKFYYHTYDILKLPKAELRQLANLKMVNPVNYPYGYEFEKFLQKQAKKNFADCDLKPTKKRSTMSLDLPIITKSKKKKPEPLAQVTGWFYDHVTREMVIERSEGQNQRFYECNEFKKLSKNDILTMANLSFRDYENDEEGEMFMKMFLHVLE